MKVRTHKYSLMRKFSKWNKSIIWLYWFQKCKTTFKAIIIMSFLFLWLSILFCHSIAFFPFEFELFQINHPVAITHYLPSDFWGWLKAESLSGWAWKALVGLIRSLRSSISDWSPAGPCAADHTENFCLFYILCQ